MGSGELDGRWAAVTGGSRGIGLAIATRFAAEGANVVLIARDPAALAYAKDAVTEASAPERSVLTFTADVGQVRSIDEVFDQLERAIPRLDVLVANAGSGAVAPFLELRIEDWQRVVDLNLTGTFRVCQRAARLMVALCGDDPAHDRAILVISSVRAFSALPGRVAYTATKAGANQLVRVAARELAEHRIRVNALSPGITETALTVEQNRTLFDAAVQTVPFGRAGLPTDMAEAALFLCSERAKFITAANLVVDGGESLV